MQILIGGSVDATRQIVVIGRGIPRVTRQPGPSFGAMMRLRTWMNGDVHRAIRQFRGRGGHPRECLRLWRGQRPGFRKRESTIVRTVGIRIGRVGWPADDRRWPIRVDGDGVGWLRLHGGKWLGRHRIVVRNRSLRPSAWRKWLGTVWEYCARRHNTRRHVVGVPRIGRNVGDRLLASSTSRPPGIRGHHGVTACQYENRTAGTNGNAPDPASRQALHESLVHQLIGEFLLTDSSTH